MEKIDFSPFLGELFSFELYHLEIPLIEIYHNGINKSNKNIQKDIIHYIKKNDWDLLSKTTDFTQLEAVFEENELEKENIILQLTDFQDDEYFENEIILKSFFESKIVSKQTDYQFIAGFYQQFEGNNGVNPAYWILVAKKVENQAILLQNIQWQENKKAYLELYNWVFNAKLNEITATQIIQLLQITELNKQDNLWFRASLLHENVGLLKNLTYLDWDGYLSTNKNIHTNIPTSIGDLENLETLAFGTNLFTELPNSIKKLKKLKKLFLYSNKIEILPEIIGELENLEELVLYGNKISVLPENITQLTQLKMLRVDNKQLTALPSNIHLLTNLEQLLCDTNPLQVLPENICYLSKLKHLNCSRNKLTKLPENLGNLTSLVHLNCSGNFLKILPESTKNLINLVILKCYRNELATLPENFEQLKNLKEVECFANLLTDLPINMEKLKKLRLLNCSYNQLTNFPDELKKIKNCDYSHNLM